MPVVSRRPRRRRKKDQGGLDAAGCAALVATGLVLASAVVGLFSFLFWVLTEFLAAEQPRAESAWEFDLDDDEKAERQELRRTIARISKRLGRIAEMGDGLPMRMDGSYDARNRLGKDLNKQIETLTEEYTEANQSYKELSETALSGLSWYVTIKSARFGARSALAVFAGVFWYYYKIDPQALESFSNFIIQWSKWRPFGDDKFIYSSLIAAAGISTIAGPTIGFLWSFRVSASLADVADFKREYVIEEEEESEDEE